MNKQVNENVTESGRNFFSLLIVQNLIQLVNSQFITFQTYCGGSRISQTRRGKRQRLSLE